MISKYSFDRNYVRILNKKILQIKKINFYRNNKAKIFQKTIKNNNIKLIKHNEGGVYWRQNALLKKDRDKLQKYLFLKNIYARNYFPTLDQVFPFIYDKNIPLAKTFQRGVLNFWVGEQTSKKDIIETNMHINNFFK